MGYLYEDCDPESFQQLCQSLFARDFRLLQCFPIGQPDGGRDGVDRASETVLQVKFKRKNEKDNANWLIETLKKELPKIQRLSDLGAKQYIIATNAQGTSHAGCGSIDIVQAWLDDNVPIPAICFWRDDLDRRLDNASDDLKLKYSKLHNLENGMTLVLAHVFGPNSDRQRTAIEHFIASQYERDKTVKFQQANLSNDLLDLFVDVPVEYLNESPEEALNVHSAKNQEVKVPESDVELPLWANSDIHDPTIIAQNRYGRPRPTGSGAANLILNNDVQRTMLVGAPGQGKSTLAQYVCQMHRARYLNKHHELKRFAETHGLTDNRIPIRMDLPHFAAFLAGNSPYIINGSPPQPASLDSYLAHLIRELSGGIDFTPYDVTQLIWNSPILLFMDGLDEVANPNSRDEVVKSITDALTRWNIRQPDLQVVVASRPSAFGPELTFSKLGFTTITLQDIDIERACTFADKWVVARGLSESDQLTVKKILEENLQLAHIRDLTRNLMQLTILLELIYLKGNSLPDMRTQLYQEYVTLFLDRESEKSIVVRNNRHVILAFLQYLAWVLQSEAEAKKTSGRISAKVLQDMAREYLIARNLDISIATDHFQGGLDRVFVLVMRIQGELEFEVQGIREFLCAQYLYTTAPRSAIHDNEPGGDLVQRFEALASNPYWLNVCRFYAGSYSRAEISGLVSSLTLLINSPDLGCALHARRVGLLLIQDRVFSFVKNEQERLIDAIFNNAAMHALLVDDETSTVPALSVECGRNHLRNRIFDQLKELPLDVDSSYACDLIRQNGGHELSKNFCELVVDQVGEDRTLQLDRMFQSGASLGLEPVYLWHLLVDDSPDSKQLLRRFTGLICSEPTVAEAIPSLILGFRRGVLDGQVQMPHGAESKLGSFAYLMDGSFSLFNARMAIDAMKGICVKNEPSVKTNTIPTDIEVFLDSVLNESDQFLDAFVTSAPFNLIAEIARENFGETWSTMSIAVIAAGIGDDIERDITLNELFNSQAPVVSRSRAAFLRREDTNWWLQQLEQASSCLDRKFWAALVITWAGLDTLRHLAAKINGIIDGLDEDEYYALRATVHWASVSTNFADLYGELRELDLEPFSNRAAVLVSISCAAEAYNLKYTLEQGQNEPLRDYLQTRQEVFDCYEWPDSNDQPALLAWARRFLQVRRRHLTKFIFLDVNGIDYHVWLECAQEILANPLVYPFELWQFVRFMVTNGYRPNDLHYVSTLQNWRFD